MSDGSEDKKHPASDTKLRKQREKGSVPSGQESAGFFACAIGLLLLLASADLIWEHIKEMVILVFDQITLPFEEAQEVSLNGLRKSISRILLPIVGLVVIGSFLVILIYNKGFLFSMKPVTPQMSRVSPMQGLKRIFGRRGMTETVVSVVRITIWLVIAGGLGLWAVYELAAQWPCSGSCAVNEIVPIFRLLTILAIILMCLAAIADMIVQRSVFLQEQKMTETEQKNERKEQSGAPELRQERRRRMREANQPLRKANPQNATMCIFFGDRAIAIEFQPPEVHLPYVVAKAATAEESRRLRKLVTANGWPETENEKLVRGGMTTAPGDVLDHTLFAEFVSVVQEMFD